VADQEISNREAMLDGQEAVRVDVAKADGAAAAETAVDEAASSAAGEDAKQTRSERAAQRMNAPYDPEAAREKRAARQQRMKDFAYRKTPEKLKNPSSLQVRLRTGTVYVGLSVLCLLLSRWSTLFFIVVTAGICAGEFYYMLRSDAKLPNETIGVIAAMCYPVATFFLGLPGMVYVTVGLMVALTVWYVFWMRSRIADVGISLFGAVYVGLQLSAIIMIREALPGIQGGFLLFVMFCAIWANDAFAYLFGSKFGKHKLAPKTSPKKSWEGFFAGLIGSMALWCFALFIPALNINIYQALLFGLVCGIAGVFGDLCESRIKRGTGFKDSGTIMPGHGGLFDRCDSLITTAVVAALLLFGTGCLQVSPGFIALL
jgi:phosphatidate cytidylyltransferase